METELTVDTTSPERNLGVSQSRREYRLVSPGVSQETNTSQQGLESLRSLMEEVFDRWAWGVFHGPVSPCGKVGVMRA